MDEIEQAVSLFRGTSVHDDVLTVWNYYKSIENDFTDFEKSFSITCPARCGRCCENFIPDVTYLEALAAGFYVFIIENRDVSFLTDWKSRHTCCPLFDCETKRCSAYRVRPVICRTFSSAASKQPSEPRCSQTGGPDRGQAAEFTWHPHPGDERIRGKDTSASSDGYQCHASG